VSYPSGSPIVAVRVEPDGAHFRIYMQREDGTLTVVNGAAVVGGLRYLGDVLIHLLAHGVPLVDAAHCLQELEPEFDAQAEVIRRSETDMAAWRMADHLRREELKANFRQRSKEQ
jgi:hypothetical protein